MINFVAFVELASITVAIRTTKWRGRMKTRIANILTNLYHSPASVITGGAKAMNGKKYWTVNHKRVLMVRQLMSDCRYVIVTVSPEDAPNRYPQKYSVQKKFGKFEDEYGAQRVLDHECQWNDAWEAKK